MAKRKRKPTAAQRDKGNIEIAKYLKRQGLLSKQTKLHGGKYVSRGVVKRVAELKWIKENNYQAVKVPRKKAAEAKELGLFTYGNRIVVPKDRKSKKRLEQGLMTGLQPIPGGQIQFVILPYSSMTELLRGLYSGAVDRMKEPQEGFAFTFYGNQSHEMFKNGAALYEYLTRYQDVINPFTGGVTEHDAAHFANFRLYRVLPSDWNPPSFETLERKKRGNRLYRSRQHDERVVKKRYKSINELSATAAEKRRAADRKRKKDKYAAMGAAEKEEYSAKALNRALKSREARRKLRGF